MSAHKYIERICWICVAFSILLAVIFMNGEALGIQAADRVMGYESKLFDTSAVHTIDIVMDDWDSFIETCENEEYAACSAVIDGEAYKNIGIRAKGNTSLSTVSSMNSDRYSFKIEFDQYDSTKNYHGLDKLSLNNLIQDNTLMKDFLVYEMMRKAGAAAPLCSFVYITVNGEDWGLYLAVEGVENSFLQRNYGSNYGDLYKPDSMSFGGGRGNGRNFDMADFESLRQQIEEQAESGELQLPEGIELPEDFEMPDMSQMPGGFPFGGQMGGFRQNGSGETPAMPEGGSGGRGQMGFGGNAGGFQMPDMGNMGGNRGGMGGMGSEDVKLQYIDDDPDSYPNIFDSAKTDITAADKARLIASLKSLSERQDLEDVLDIDAVIRYFVVHNFVVNGDSYTGSMIHNYYLYEEDGKLSMLPWDYNLAFGTFQGSNASSAVNDPIDLSGMDDRPMANWIFADEAYTELYHQYFSEFIASAVDSGWLNQLISSTAELITPYVEKDPSRFCTVDEFQTGVKAIQEFCSLRAESVSGQLNGTIPSTSEGQSADSSSLIGTGSLNLSDMGTMGMGRGGFGGENFGNGGRGETSGTPAPDSSAEDTAPPAEDPVGRPFSEPSGDDPQHETMTPPDGGMPEGTTPSGGQQNDAAPPQMDSQTGQQGMPPSGNMGGAPGGMGFPHQGSEQTSGMLMTSMNSDPLPFGQQETPERTNPLGEGEFAFDENGQAVNEEDVPSQPAEPVQDSETNAAENAAGIRSNTMPEQSDASPSSQAPLLIGISAVVLIAAIAVVLAYKRR